MARWEQDAVDFACEAWAYQWMALFGRDPRKASEYLGRLSCTLSLVTLLHDGAGGGGTLITQQFPEGFLGDGLLVNIVIKRMPESDREMIWRHYVERWYFLKPVYDVKKNLIGCDPARLIRPVKQGVIAARMGVSRSEYHSRRDQAKSFIRGALAGAECLDTKVGARDPAFSVAFGQVR